MHLVGVRVEMPTNNPIVLLREANGQHRVLPIFIGPVEATAIAFALHPGPGPARDAPRPRRPPTFPESNRPPATTARRRTIQRRKAKPARHPPGPARLPARPPLRTGRRPTRPGPGSLTSWRGSA